MLYDQFKSSLSSRQREMIVNLMPNHVFALWINCRKMGIKIQRYDRVLWKVTSDGVSLLSYTPKITSFGMRVFEEKFEKYFRIEPEDFALDIGACIGDTTVPMARKAAQVWAFEPEPINFRFLRLNIGQFSTAHAFKTAISDHPGLKMMNISRSITGHSIEPDKAREKGKIKIPCITLDMLPSCFTFVKIDCQGHESKIFVSGKTFLDRIQKLIVETHRTPGGNSTAMDVYWHLKGRFRHIEWDGGAFHAWQAA